MIKTLINIQQYCLHFKREPAMRLAMAGYHQHYLQNSFDQPRVVRACKIPNDHNDLNSSADMVQFQLSHQITLTQNTNAKGFSACCERDYGKAKKRMKNSFFYKI